MNEELQTVLDASALLAALQNEPGAAEVKPGIGRAAISSVNWAEVLQKSVARGAQTAPLQERVTAMGLTIYPFTDEDAEMTANIWPETRPLGLSLGDRVCIALARRLGLPVLTTDRLWARLDMDVEVRVIR